VPLSSYIGAYCTCHSIVIACAGTYYVGPSVVITCIDATCTSTSCTDLSVGASHIASPYVDSSRIRCTGDVGCIADRWMIGAVKVQLLSSKDHLLTVGRKIGVARNSVRDMRLHPHTGRTPVGGLQNGPSYAGVPPP
jgi:hypothetical protein